jgi:signal transduction histidine kinase
MADRAARSLRTRLLAWYVAAIMVVVTLVGGAVCWAVWLARLVAIDADLRSRIDRVASAVRPGSGGAFDLELPPDATAYFQQPGPRRYYAVWSREVGLVDRSDPDLAIPEPPPAGARTRGTAREVVDDARGFTILIGRDIGDVREELWSLAGTMALAGAGGMALAVVCAWFVAGRALAPVQRISETARLMARGELTARIAVEQTETELGQVASALNLAFDRLHEAIDRQRRFTADASHELRTPVAMLSAEVDWALMRARSAGEYREALETCSRVAIRMRGLVEGLLILARADSNELPVRREPVRLDHILEDVVASIHQFARERRVAIRAVPLAATIRGDSDRLVQLFTNLLYNSVAYNRPDGEVSIDSRKDGDDVVVTVRDTGIGIPAEDLPRIFDRFYRGSEARSREPGGAGLGLAVAKWVAEAHGGAILCRSGPGRGAEFEVRLPAAAAGAHGHTAAGERGTAQDGLRDLRELPE